MNKTMLTLCLLGAAAYAAWVYTDKGTTNPFAPSPTPSTPVSPVMPSGTYVVFCTQPNCPPCERMKKELLASPLVKPIGITFADISARALSRKYKVSATPTVILFVGGKESKRKEGYMTPEEFVAWVGMLPTSTPVRELEDE